MTPQVSSTSSSSSGSASTFPFGAASLLPLQLPGAALPPQPVAPPPALPLPVAPCNCEEFCQQVRKVMGSYTNHGKIIEPAKRVVYLEHLTAAQAQHAQDM